jgi:hypothetical protein
VNTIPTWLRVLPPWARYVGVWIALMIVCAPQTISSGAAKSWSEVFWLQLNYWTTWAILGPGIFLALRSAL